MNFAFSIRQTGVPLGGVVASLAAPWIEARLGWPAALLALGGLSLPLILLLEPLRPALDDQRVRDHAVGLQSWRSMLAAIRAGPGLGTLAFLSVGFATAQMTLTSYYVTYLHERFDLTLLAAGVLLSVIQVVGVIARLLWGHVADRWTGAPFLLVVMALMTAAAFMALGLLGAGSSRSALALLAVALGSCAMGWNGLFLSEVARRSPRGEEARTLSAILPLTFGGALTGPPLMAAVVSLTGSYGLGFVTVSLLPLAGAVLMLRQRMLWR
jgi:nitrate/nitrite transporter NarK